MKQKHCLKSSIIIGKKGGKSSQSSAWNLRSFEDSLDFKNGPKTKTKMNLRTKIFEERRSSKLRCNTVCDITKQKSTINDVIIWYENYLLCLPIGIQQYLFSIDTTVLQGFLLNLFGILYISCKNLINSTSKELYYATVIIKWIPNNYDCLQSNFKKLCKANINEYEAFSKLLYFLYLRTPYREISKRCKIVKEKSENIRM